ncbi:phage tail protein [Clostridium perfringens]|uniref:phage tail protein n=1 Tax=Clostridium perfringens TaxID=1502 RepID=UPI001E37E0DD|nr:phage tail protein [Clostridium perfringens]WVL78373.1 phage tail protein [Clostridium perfringens]
MQSSAIFILNKQEKVINILNNVDSPNRNPFFDDILTQTLSTGADTYKFTTTFNKKNSRSITVGNKVAFMLDGKYMLFQIVSVNDVHGDNLEMEVYCESAGLSLINSVCRSQRIVSCDVRKFLEAILQDTEWNIGFVDMSLSNVFDLELETASVYSLLQNNIKKYDAEIRFRCEIVNGRISKKFIDVFRTRGKVSGKRFEFGKNVESISRQIDSSELFTALIGEGKNGLNFSDISLEDVPNKPEGQDFVFDQESYNRYNQNGYHLMGVFKYETESKEELLRETYKKLQECKNPKIKYTVNVSLLGGDVEVGETVNIIDRFFEPPLLLQARVSKLEKSLSDNSNVRCELSNFVEVSSNINLELLNKVKDFVDNSITDRFPIGTDDIQDGAVTGQKIYENSITTDHLMAGVVTAEKVHAESIKANHIAANQVKAQHIEAGAIDATKIKADSIESEHIVANAIKSEHIDAESITSDKIQAGSIESQHIKANQIESGHIKSNSIDADKIQANSIESKHIKADAIKSEHIDANSVTSDKIQAGSVTADKIQAGAITAGSSIVAEGAIGSAQISSLEANKINTGTLDTSLVNIAGPDGNMEITGNQLLVNNKGKNRVIVGEYRNDEDETKYGLLVRGEDDTTIMIDERGVHNAGITDGAIDNNKVSQNANIDGTKLNINSVIREVNENGTESISGTKVVVGDKNLEVELKEQQNTITEHGQELSSQKSQIIAMEDKISLKVDSQKFTEETQNIKQSIGVAKQEAIEAASQDATNKANSAKDEAINSASQDASQKAEQALQNAKAYTNVEVSTVDKKLEKNTSEIKVLKDEISTKVSQADIDKSIANIKFSDVNMILNSGDFENKKHWSITNGEDNLVIENNVLVAKFKNYAKWGVYVSNDSLRNKPLDVAKDYTVVCKLKSSKNQTITFNICNGDSSDYVYGKELNITTEWQIFKFTFKPSRVGDERQFRFITESLDYDFDLYIEFVKMVEGKTSSDNWTPAPEDLNQVVIDNIDVVNEKISSVESKLTQDLNGVKVNVGSLESKTTQIESNVNVVKSELTGKIEDALQDSKEYSDELKNQAIDSSKEYVNVQINATNSKVSEVASGLDILKDKVESKVSQSDIDKSLVEVNDSIKVTQENINEVSSKVTQLKDSVNTEISSLKSKTQSLESDLGDKATKVEVQELNSQIAQQNVSLEGITNRVSQTESKTTQLETNISNVNKDLSGKIADNLNQSKEYTDEEVNKSKDEAINSSKDYTNSQIKVTNEKVSSVESSLDILKEKIESKVSQSDIDNSLIEVKDSIKVANSRIESVSSTVTQLKDSVTTEISSLKSKNQTIEANLEGKATKQEVQELNSQVAEQKVSLEGITNRVGQTESKTSQLESNITLANRDLSSKIDENLETSKGYADQVATSKSEEAKNQAISSASQDATNKANSAKDEAINSSKEYTNVQISATNSKITGVESSLNVLKEKIESKVSQSDIDKSISSIQIGGKNLLPFTKDFKSRWNLNCGGLTDGLDGCKAIINKRIEVPSPEYRQQVVVTNINGLSKGDIVTISGYYYIDNSINLPNDSGNEISIRVYYNGKSSYYDILNTKFNSSEKDKWIYFNTTSSLRKDVEISQVNLLFSLSKTGFIKLTKVKLEKGNKATDWTPAPEDVDFNIQDGIRITDEKINKVSSTVTQLKDSVTTEISSLKSKTQTIESNLDGKASKSELQELNTQVAQQKVSIDGITNRVGQTETKTSQLEGSINEVNRDLTGKINSGVQSAKDYATGQANQAKQEAINASSQDATNKANQAQENAKAYTNGQISSVSNKVNSVESSLNILKDKVETKVSKEEVQESIANIKIGGRNLALKTSLDYSNPYSDFNGDINRCPSVARVVTDGLSVGDVVTVRLLYKYENIVQTNGQTNSAWLQGSGNVTGWGSGSFSGSVRLSNFSGNGTYEFLYNFIVTKEHMKNNYWDVNLRHDYILSGSVCWKMFKVEKGNKATDWTPAPEDLNQLVADNIKVVDSKISSVSSSVTQLRDSVNTQISSLTSKTQSLESSLDGKATKQEVSEINNRVTSIDTNLQGITQRVSNTESKTSQLEQGLNGKASVQEVQNVKEQVSSVEVNLNGITNRVQSTENNVSRLDGQIQNAVTKSEFTEFKQNTDSFKFTVEQRSTMNNLVPNSSFEGYGRAWTCNGEFWAGPYAGYDFKGRFCGAIKNADRYNNEKYLMTEKCFRVKKNTTYTLNFKFALEKNVNSMDAFVILSDSESTNYGQAIHMYNASGGSQTNNYQEQCITKTFNTGDYEWVWLRFDHNGMKADVNVSEWCWLYISEVGVYEGDVGQVKWMPSSGETYSSNFLLDREGFKASFDDGSYAYMGKNGFEWYNAGSGHTYHALTYVTSFDIPTGNPGRAYVKLPVEFTSRKSSLKWTVATRGYYYSTTGSFFPYHVHCSGYAPAYEENGQLVCPVEGVCKIQNSNNSNDVQFRPLTAMLIAIA